MTLNVFDFDDTLFRIPAHTTDASFDLKGDVHTWYDNPVSLDFNKYRVQLIQSVADCMNSEDTENIIITRRIPEMLPSILALLKHYGLSFNKIYPIGHKNNKYKVLEDHFFAGRTQEGEQLYDAINIFEDSLYQVLEYRENISSAIDDLICYYFVDKTHVIEIGDIYAVTLGKIKLTENSKPVIS